MKWIVDVTKCFDVQWEVEAKDYAQAQRIADSMLESKTHDELMNSAQEGYWEIVDIQESE